MHCSDSHFHDSGTATESKWSQLAKPIIAYTSEEEAAEMFPWAIRSPLNLSRLRDCTMKNIPTDNVDDAESRYWLNSRRLV